MDRSYVVYKAVSPSGGIYIGCTSKGLESRKRDHLCHSKKFPHYKFYRAIAKYGFDAFEWSVLGTYSTVKEMHEAECHFIAELDTCASGYNITTGGQGTPGRKITPEQSARFSKSQRARFEDEAQRNLAAVGVLEWIASNPDKHAEYVARRTKSLRTAKMRRLASEKQSAYASDPDVRALMSSRTKLRHAAKPEIAEKISKSLGGRPIEVIRDGEVIAVYPTLQSCARALGVLAGNLCSCLKGRRNHTHGYTFRYSIEGDSVAANPPGKPAADMA